MSVAVVFFAALGAFVGSFIGVVAERMHTGSSWVRGRSQCNSCGSVLSPLDLVPVVSWLIARGRCRACGSHVPARYLLIEAVMAFLFILSYLMYGLTLSLLFLLSAIMVLGTIVLYDLAHTVVPRELSGTLAVLSLFYAFSYWSLPAAGLALLIAGVVGSVFLLMHVLSGGRWMGLGDAPVAFSLSLLVGPDAHSALAFSFWIGALVGIFILVSRPKGHRMGIEIPFVPFLAAGFLLALFTSWNPFTLVGW